MYKICKLLFPVFIVTAVMCAILLFPTLYYSPEWIQGQRIGLLIIGILSVIGAVVTGILAGRGKK